MFKDFQKEFSGIGYQLVSVSYYNRGSIKENLGSELQPIARDLHLVETVRLPIDGGHSIRTLVERVNNNSNLLTKLVTSIAKDA